MKIFCFFIFSILCITVKGQLKVHSISQNSIEFHIDSFYGRIQHLECLNDSVQLNFNHQKNTIQFSGLKPSTLISLCAAFEKNGQIEYFEKVAITKSSSSGTMQVFFNNEVDSSFRKSDYRPQGTQFGELQLALRNLIRNAQSSIDFAAYNTNEIFIVNELIDAHNRGVRVRVVTDDETTNSGWNAGAPFPIVRGNIGSGLMHNKFLIIDKDSDLNSMVITGSMNFTTNQMRSDPNHLIFIQDKSLAIGYTIEFEEMWGSDNAVPNLGNARFGVDKLKNTPENFIIGSVPVELYFSPSDETTSEISNRLAQTKENMLLGLMIFTNWELRDQVVNSLQNNVSVRWIVDDVSNSASVMQAIIINNGEVKTHSDPDLFHHKYAVLDEDTTNPVLVTGSHNWTFSAETINDENTLIFYDQRLTNIFRQEFEARWKELIVSNVNEYLLEEKALIYPNPSEGLLLIDKNVYKIEIYDLFGNKLEEISQPGNMINFDSKEGMYIFKLYTEKRINLKKIILR